MEPEDEGGLLVAVVDLARQVEHAADVDKHLAVAQDPGHWHCNEGHLLSRELHNVQENKLLLSDRGHEIVRI